MTIDRKFGLLWVKVGSVVFNDFCQLLPSLPLNPPLVCPFKKVLIILASLSFLSEKELEWYH